MAAVTKMVLLGLVLMSLSFNAIWVGAQVHHVVGGDRGWATTSDVSKWSSNRVFVVGDQIWFTYSAAQESIAEVKSKEEYEACDVSNPIKMYTDGLDSVSLDGEGIRYFASTKQENCKKGLKLHVEVVPERKRGTTVNSAVEVLASGPTSGSTHIAANFLGLIAGMIFWYMGF